MKPIPESGRPLLALRQTITSAMVGRTVVLGIGNPLCGDDDLGCETARQLQAHGVLHALVCEEMPENFTAEVKACNPDSILLVDAVDFFAGPGDVIYLRREELHSERFNTHKPALGLLMRYLESETGAEVALIGIQPKNRALHAPLSPEVHESVTLLAAFLSDLAQPAGRIEDLYTVRDRTPQQNAPGSHSEKGIA
ncbi:MAG TPA: hydrogenase maturation protease [bacterium]|nr:hydrogenase maturation protease [bacterium]